MPSGIFRNALNKRRWGSVAEKGMDWSCLMSRKKLGGRERPEEPGRSPFERDADRIVFSTAFRRLHDKTQVFPFPEFDFVHSRLTHSLEASRVGRSLGALVGARVISKYKPENVTEHDFGAVVAAACLAHDLGNPPFGHAGEFAVRRWFERQGRVIFKGLTKRQCQDLRNFEGNAQGFRILTRLQQGHQDGGMQLTCATLVAFMKYPKPSIPANKKTGDYLGGKYGFLDSEAHLFAKVAREVGLVEQKNVGRSCWCRHPLAFLVEAADDICYGILDVEDGFRLGYIRIEEVKALLLPLFDTPGERDEVERRMTAMNDADRTGYLRARAIGKLIDDVTQTFWAQEVEILRGKFRGNLTKHMKNADILRALNALATERCYRADKVLQIEAAGYNIIDYLLEQFVPSLVDASPDKYSETLVELLPFSYLESGTRYERILRATDFVSGMTDSYALGLYRRLRGVELPVVDK